VILITTLSGRAFSGGTPESINEITFFKEEKGYSTKTLPNCLWIRALQKQYIRQEDKECEEILFCPFSYHKL